MSVTPLIPRSPKRAEPDTLYDGPGPWTPIRVMLARRCTEEADNTLKDCGYTMHDIEVVRWTLLGRTNDEALAVLSGQGAGGVLSVPRVAQ